MSWTIRMSGGAEEQWSWSERGAPILDQLGPVRTPRSSEHNRHIPVTAYSMTNARHLELESGLEHDLVRRVDRDPSVAWIVPQPFRLGWTEPKVGQHTPDLLTVHVDGRVTVWDARGADDQGSRFRVKAAITANECEAVGWRYQIFDGLGRIERLNLLWLHGFRRRPEWSDRYVSQIRLAVAGQPVPLGELFRLDDGSGGLKTVVWHLIWKGALSVDIRRPLTERTAVGLGREWAHV
ncbi:TnsA-like heteromeric transposase endonuclease subunit [Mycolicibacterium alvei]|nr:TnsA-like heteromeric transposase endonuclease subunit [Mycolicibacterium alvei]